jgi:hypothetical protein
MEEANDTRQLRPEKAGREWLFRASIGKLLKNLSRGMSCLWLENNLAALENEVKQEKDENSEIRVAIYPRGRCL